MSVTLVVAAAGTVVSAGTLIATATMVRAAPLIPIDQGPALDHRLAATSVPDDRQAAPRWGAALIPVVVFGHDARRTPEAFAAENHLDSAEVRRTQGASGLIQCGDAHGAGQITLANNVVTTAAHVFFDENGIPRAPACTFDLMNDGKTIHVPIDLSSIVAGSTNPYAIDPAHDWAVARLERHVTGVKPYAIARGMHANEPMTFVARGHVDWGEAKNLSIEQCILHDQISVGEEGTREFSFDCDTGDGASGGALMFDKDRVEVGGILVGWRSNHPFNAMPFSHTHYNFAVTLEGEFRKAVIAAAGNMMVQK